MNSSILYFPISALLNAVISWALVLYFILKKFDSRTAKFNIYLCSTIGFWSTFYFLWQLSTDEKSALFWSQMLMFAAIFASVSYLHLILVFLNLDKEKKHKFSLYIFYLFCLVWVFTNFIPGLFIQGVRSISYFKFWPIPGPFYVPYLVFFAAHLVYALVLLIKRYLIAKGNERIQIGLVIGSIILVSIGGSSNYFLWYGIDLAPWGNIAIGVLVLLTAYLTMRFGLLDIELVSAELFTGLMIAGFFIYTLFSSNIIEFATRAFILLLMIAFGATLVHSVNSEIKRREETSHWAKSLEEANLKLRELDKQKTDFLSFAAHQLRTPLSIINGYIELLADEGYGKIPKEAKDILKNMDESNGRLVKLVDSFLGVTRLEQGRTKYDFTENDINQIISKVVKELDEKARQRKISLDWFPIPNLPKSYLDEEKIRNVVYNFVDNAIKYSEDGMIVIQANKEKNGIAVRVQDMGRGFNKQDEVNFFQKFYRGDNVKGVDVNGTGLGLYVCRMFVEAHRGKVWAHSKGVGKGSEFGFWIPVVRSAQQIPSELVTTG